MELNAEILDEQDSLEAWLTSLGLPMYIESFREVQYDDIEMMPYMEEKHFAYAGVLDPRHMRRLLAAVQNLKRPEELSSSECDSLL